MGLLEQFKRDCAAAEVSPVAVLKEAGIHSSLWWKWEAGKVSPTLRNFEAAQKALAAIQRRKRQKPHSEPIHGS